LLYIQYYHNYCIGMDIIQIRIIVFTKFGLNNIIQIVTMFMLLQET